MPFALPREIALRMTTRHAVPPIVAHPPVAAVRAAAEALSALELLERGENNRAVEAFGDPDESQRQLHPKSHHLVERDC